MTAPPAPAAVVAAFGAAVRAAGYAFTGSVIPDGKPHQVPMDDDARAHVSGEYHLTLDAVRPTGTFRDLRMDRDGIGYQWTWDVPRLETGEPVAPTPAAAAPAGPTQRDTGGAPPTPAPATDDAAFIAKLAALSPLDYDRRREAAAETLGVTKGTLDRVVRNARAAAAQAARPALVEDLAPWPERVRGTPLAAEIRALLRRHVVLPDHADVALTLWAIGTYVYDAQPVWPKLLISAPEKRCGKSTLLGAVAALACRAVTASNTTAAVIYRLVEACAPTLLLDEADTYIHGDDGLRGIINSGHIRSTAYVLRTDTDPITRAMVPARYSTWAPMAIAMIQDPPDTIRDRSIHIRMRRRLPGETASRLPPDPIAAWVDTRRRCHAWAAEHLEALREADPSLPDGGDRARDNWRPLAAIADRLGGDWPRLARAAFRGLTPEDDGDAIGPQILADLRDLYRDRGTDRMHTADIVAALVALEDRPWATWRRGQAMTAHSLARLLAPYGARPHQILIGAANRNGYLRDDLADAIRRYLPPPRTQGEI